MKLEALLFVVLGAAGATAACLGLMWVALKTPAGLPLLGLYHAVARLLFGLSAQEANAAYTRVMAGNSKVIVAVIFVAALLLFFYLVMGRFARWFDRINAQVHRMTEDTAEEVHLPRALAPVEEDLNGIRLILARREAEAEQSAQRARDLVVFLAHDLKTPLTSVIGYLNLLHDQPDLEAAERAKYTGIALDKAKRLEELISEFFDINRLELESIGEEGVFIDLSMLLEQLADEFWPLLEEKNLTLRPAIGPGLTVRGDPDKLARVFDNVLRNAVNYSVPGSAVGLRAFRQGPEIVVSISNEGLEIPEQELSHIFEKFYRLDAARSTRTGGAGLGLAIAKEIVERHGGTIRAETTGKRSLFTSTLPARQMQYKQKGRPRLSAVGGPFL